MSEEICPKCGKQKSECRCFEVTLKHEGLSKANKGDELSKTKAELKEKTDVLALIALKDFEKERDALIDSAREDLSDEQIEKLEERLDSPDALEGAKIWVKILSQAREYGAPAGKVTMSPAGRATMPTSNPRAGKFEQMKRVIDELYEVAYADPTKSQAEKKEANRRLDSMFSELIRGVSVSQRRGRFPRFSKTACPACGNLIEGVNAQSCPECGWQLVVPRQERRHH